MSKICCFTGHRIIPSADADAIKSRLRELLIELIEERGFTDFRAGGAIGFDSIAASEIIDLKAIYPQIKLHLVLPCKNQSKRFNKSDKKMYDYSLNCADSIVYMQERYSAGVMHIRNRALVDGSDLCIAYLTEHSGGTFYTVGYAEGVGVKVINIAPGDRHEDE